MNKKTILLIASAAMGAGLVGGTFAAYAYAVTDNADTKHVLVSPGTVSVDEETIYATLEWGQGTNVSSAVSELKMNTYRKAAVLDLRATTSDTKSFTGKLVITLADESASHAEGAAQLIDYLNVDVYATNLTAGEGGLIAEETLDGKTALTDEQLAEITVNHEQANLYTVVVSLKAMNAATYAEMAADLVNISIDWDVADSVNVADGARTFYVTGFGEQVRAFAWNDDGDYNKDWPGIDMNQIGYDIWALSVDTAKFNKIIFSSENGGQTSDIVIADEFDFENGECMFVRNEEDTDLGGYVRYYNHQATDLEYYMLGLGNDWEHTTEANQLVFAEDHYEKVITVPEGGVEFKVIEKKNWFWYSEETTAGNGDNFKINDAGNYKISFYPETNGAGKYIVCAGVE